jgi:hypothetical protein
MKWWHGRNEGIKKASKGRIREGGRKKVENVWRNKGAKSQKTE